MHPPFAQLQGLSLRMLDPEDSKCTSTMLVQCQPTGEHGCITCETRPTRCWIRSTLLRACCHICSRRAHLSQQIGSVQMRVWSSFTRIDMAGPSLVLSAVAEPWSSALMRGKQPAGVATFLFSPVTLARVITQATWSFLRYCAITSSLPMASSKVIIGTGEKVRIYLASSRAKILVYHHRTGKHLLPGSCLQRQLAGS
jgi:hypothetical protein